MYAATTDISQEDDLSFFNIQEICFFLWDCITIIKRYIDNADIRHINSKQPSLIRHFLKPVEKNG